MNLEMRLSLCRWQRCPINVKKYDNFHFEQLNEQRYRYAENEILELHSLLFVLLDGRNGQFWDCKSFWTISRWNEAKCRQEYCNSSLSSSISNSAKWKSLLFLPEGRKKQDNWKSRFEHFTTWVSYVFRATIEQSVQVETISIFLQIALLLSWKEECCVFLSLAKLRQEMQIFSQLTSFLSNKP